MPTDCFVSLYFASDAQTHQSWSEYKNTRNVLCFGWVSPTAAFLRETGKHNTFQGDYEESFKIKERSFQEAMRLELK